MSATYEDFVRGKVDFIEHYGFDVDDTDVNPLAFPHQRDIIRWAVKGGRRRGVELNHGYFLDGVKYLQAEQRAREMPALFDLGLPQPGAA